MSSSTWTPRAGASEAAPCRLELWRAAETQHVVATRAPVDSLADKEVLKAILEDPSRRSPYPPLDTTICSTRRFGIRHRRMARVFADTAIRVAGMAQKRCAPAAPNSAHVHWKMLLVVPSLKQKNT
jgi:hypothetical protein